MKMTALKSHVFFKICGNLFLIDNVKSIIDPGESCFLCNLLLLLDEWSFILVFFNVGVDYLCSKIFKARSVVESSWPGCSRVEI